MNIEEAAIAFVKAHKPDRIDLDYINDGYGSVEKYLEQENNGDIGDGGMRYAEISQFDALSGHTELVEWYEREAFNITFYNKPESERRTPDDYMPDYRWDIDFDCAISEALRLRKEPNVYDVHVTEWRDGEPYAEIDLEEYIDNRAEEFLAQELEEALSKSEDGFI